MEKYLLCLECSLYHLSAAYHFVLLWSRDLGNLTRGSLIAENMPLTLAAVIHLQSYGTNVSVNADTIFLLLG